ncbi:MAG: NAD(+)/NADH kinase [Candidatus Porifericomitaceae bacterium WSBS_2022_MAG_OTU9]
MTVPAANSSDPGNSVFKQALLFVRPHSQAAARAKTNVSSCLRQMGMEFSDSTGSEKHGFDLGIAIGGDGTLLHAARAILDMDIPLIGINTGRFGFLTDIPASKIGTMLPPVLCGDSITEYRLTGNVTVLRGNKTICSNVVVNEATVQKENVSRLCELEVHIDGKFLLGQRGDGIIIATPTGSTAYALACNGPIVHPAMEALTLVPISPHQLAYRPLCFGAEHTVEIKNLSPSSGAALTVDGIAVHALVPGDTARFKTADRRLRTIHPTNYDYFRLLREKLKWGSNLC